MTPILLEKEITSVNNLIKEGNMDEEFKLKASKLGNQVTATYEQDEDMILSLCIKLPNSYPLKSVEISCTKRLGVSEFQMRKWLLSMNTLLMTQDGSVLDACLLWKENLSKHFENVEMCPICFQLTQSNGDLPKLTCRTCKNKFHSFCMYKWFSVSNNSTCPLCKSEWQV